MTRDGAVPSKAEAARLSILSGAALTAAKLVVGLGTGSLAILSDALHSALDFVAAVVTFFVVRLADRPADEDHPYGHARAENLGALAETVLLSVTATLVLSEAYRRLFERPEAPVVSVWSFLVMGGSIIVDSIRVRALRRAAAAHRSPALEADAANFANDLLASSLVLAALAFIAVAERVPGVPEAVTSRVDAAAGAVVALFAFRVAFGLAGRAVGSLMDTVPRDLGARLGAAVEAVPGVLPGTARVRGRFVGERPFVDVTLSVERDASLEAASTVARAAEEAIRAVQPEADVVVDVRPGRPELERHDAAVRAAAHRLGLEVHNLDVLQTADGLRVDVDLELPPNLRLRQAHERSEALEREIAAALPEVKRVGVHLEPRRVQARPAVRHPETAEAVAAFLRGSPEAGSVRRVDAALTDEGAVVSVELLFHPEAALAEVHERMAELERRIRRAVPGVDRVHIDPELSAESG